MPILNLRWQAAVLAGALALHLAAQNEEDALRYSWLLPGGTARGWGLGSAMGAVGADPGAASLNPAGFGLYNTSEFSLTPGLSVTAAENTHYGTAASATNTRAYVNNFALVLCYPGKTTSNWKATQFGVSFDREASFHAQRQATGASVNSTILQQFANEARGTLPGDLYTSYPFTSGLAWDAYGIDPATGDSLNTSYVPAIPFGSDVRQTQVIDSYGRLQTTSLFFAANWIDRLYLGASVGLVGVRFERTTTHTETSLTDTVDLADLTYTEDLITSGGGVDVKVGLIGRVTDRLRLGFSFHSPKWLTLDDAFRTRMVTRFRTPDGQGNTGYEAASPDGIFRYNVNTPWNLVASAAYIAGGNGLVSVDYGYTDFTSMRLRGDNTVPDSYDFAAENNAIRDSFRGAHSVRVGTEWRMGTWYMRGGWGWWQDPYADGDLRQGTGYKRYTVGGGYRTDHLSIDLALVYGTRTANRLLYDPALVNATNEVITNVQSLVTIAYRP